MTIKGLNWLVLSTAVFVGGCSTKGDDSADDFEIDESSDDDSTAEAEDGNTGSGGGDGVFNVDQLYIAFDGVYRDGEYAAGATYISSETNTEESLPTYFQLIWLDETDWSATESEDYICRLAYDNSSAAVADFTDLEDGDEAYLTYQMDLGALTPEVSGNCEGAALHFGVESMEAIAQNSPWGFGFGPMNSDFEDELSGSVDFAALGTTAGVSWLRWRAGESDDQFSAWGFYRVVPFADDESNLLITMESEDQYVQDVDASVEPPDGYYSNQTVYALGY